MILIFRFPVFLELCNIFHMLCTCFQHFQQYYLWMALVLPVRASLNVLLLYVDVNLQYIISS